MKVEIRPVEREKWHGKSGKESFTRPHTIGALADARTMKYSHGLSKEDMELLIEKGCKYNLEDSFIQGTAHDFWESKMTQVKLENKTKFFMPEESMLDFIKVRICKASKFVANSLKEFEEGLWPFATHVIHDEAAEVESKATKIARKKRAVIETSKLSQSKKIQLIMIIGGKDVKGKSEDFVEVKLSELIEDSYDEILEHIGMDADELAVHALVLECLLKNILRKNGHKIEYNGSNIGGSEYDVVKYLLSDENNELRMRLTKVVND